MGIPTIVAYTGVYIDVSRVGDIDGSTNYERNTINCQ